LTNSLVLFPVLSASLLGVVARTRGFLRKQSKVLFLILIIASSVLVIQPLWRSPELVNAQNPSQEIQLNFSNRTATVSPSSSIYAVEGRQAATVDNLTGLMSQEGLDFYSMIQPNDVVLIKINEEWAQRGGTDTDVLKQLIQLIIDSPKGFTGEIVVADNGQWGGSMNWAESNAENHSQSTQNVVDSFSASHKVSTYDWIPIRDKQVNEYSDGDMSDGYVVNATADPITGLNVSYPKFQTVYGTYISFKYGIWNGQTYEDRLKVINLPVLKSHTNYGVTGAVKNYMGVLSNSLSNGHASIATGGMGTLMGETRMPTLTIMCAIWVNAIPDNYDGAGPDTSYDTATRTNILAASTDPVALDYWVSKYILMQTAQAIGYSDTHTLNPDNKDGTGVSDKAFGIWLPEARDALLRAGFQVTTNEQQMNVCVFKSNMNPSANASPSLSSSTSAPSSQEPIQTQNPQSTPSMQPEIILYPVAVAISTAVIVTLIVSLRRKKRTVTVEKIG
jgi:hypothetical protein